MACFDALQDAYLAGVNWETPDAVEARATPLLSGLLLARIDGKSPVEYLTAEMDKDMVRQAALALLRSRPSSLQSIRQFWLEKLQVKS